MSENAPPTSRALIWVGSSLDTLREFPSDVQRIIGFALRIAQGGGMHADAKPLKGFKGAGVVEIPVRFKGDAFRTVYTVQLATGVYVLHAFQKKSKHGIATPQEEIELVKRRLKAAQDLDAQRTKQRRQETGA